MKGDTQMSFSQFKDKYGHIIPSELIHHEYSKYLNTLPLFTGFADTFVKAFK